MKHHKFSHIVLFITVFIAAAAGAREQKHDNTLVISLSKNFQPLTFINAEGNPAGMFADIWKLWSEKTGTKIEFLPSTWSDSIENLKNGAAHIHAGLAITPEREKQMIFSQPLYENTFYLFFPLKQGKVLTLRELSGQKVGVVGNSSQEEYLKKHYPDIGLVLFKSTEEAILNAGDGKVRAVADSYLSTSADITRLGLSGEFECGREILYTRKFHAGISKENTELLALVNKGFDAISDRELAEIESRWIPDPSKRYYRIEKPKIRLTPEEEAWIRSHRTVRFGIMPDFPPFMFFEDNTYKGIHTDYIRIIGERTGIRFEMIPVMPPELDMKAKAGEIDVFPTFDVPERKAYTNFTNPFLYYNSVIITRSDMPFISGVSTLKGKKVAIVKGIKTQKLYFSQYPEIEMIEKKNVSESLKAVASSEADAYVGGSIISCYLIQKHRLINLKIAGVSDRPPEIYMYAIRKDWQELVGILNKAIATFSREEHDAILQKWFRVQVEHQPNRNEILTWAFGIGGFFTIILGVSLYWNRRLAREINYRRQAEEELIHAKEAAEAANHAKSTFLANISHEFRTPLNAVLGYAQFLQKDPDATEIQKERLNIIHKSGEHLLSLLNDILDISKIEAGRIEISPTEFSLRDFLSNITAMFQIRAEQKNIGFHYEASPDLPKYARGDQIRIRQILINLLGNAVKFTEKGRIIFQADYNAGRICFEIRDTGPGIEADELEKIFTPFHQIGSYLKKNDGTGLGLSISRKLAELMGGSLTVESTPGQGSVFRVALELPPACSAEDILEAENVSAAVGYEDKRKSLIIEEPVPPCPEDLEFLANLAKMGDIQAIRERMESLMHKDKQFAPFAEKIIRLAKEFQIGKIRKLLKSYRPNM